MFSNVFLRAALFLGAAVFVVGFANAQLSSVANPESMGTELLSAWHHGSDEQDDVNAKSAALEAQLHRQSGESEPLTKPTSSKLVDEGQCHNSSCIAAWISGVDDFESIKAPSVIDPVVTFRAIDKGNKGLAMTVRWRAPVPKRGLVPHDISHYQVMVDYGSRYRTYRVDELAANVGTNDSRRVRQWLHVNDVGVRPQHVHVRPVYRSSKQQVRELVGAPAQAGLAGYGDVINQPQNIGEINFADIDFAQCVIGSAKSGRETPISDLDSLRCPEKNIQDLYGIQYLTALTTLYLDGNPIQNIDNLSTLLELEVLGLSDTNVHDFSVLKPENFPWLSALYLDRTSIHDLTNISRLEFLETLTISGSAVQAIPDFSATVLRDLDISFSFITDLSGLSDVYTLNNLVFHGRDESAPILHGETHWQSSGDLRPLIDLASNSANRLVLIDLTDQKDFICLHLVALDEALKDYGAHEGRLKAPRDCHDLPILNAPVSSVEPSIGNLFTISWGFDGDIEKHFNQPLYQLQELTQGLDLSSEEVIIDSAATEIDFSALETRQSGVYYYRVRACGAEAGIAVCTPWSQSTGHVIMGSEGISGSEAISNIDDDGFRSCLYDHLAYFENDELVYRKTGEVLALDCQSYLIKSLEGAHQFPNLVSLNFHDNEIEDLSPLQSVLQATHLDGQSVDLSLSSNQLEQTALNALVEYDSVYINLQLQDNPLGDIDSLTGLPSITNLNLNRTGISDLDPLREVQIESLSAAGNNISTIPNLFVQHELLVSDNVLNNIQGLNGNDPINKMPASLAMLDLSKNPVGQIPHYSDVLGSLALLQKLYLRDAGVDEIYFASSMSNLKDLDVSYNLLSDLSPLIGNLSLESLTANRTEITSLEPLAGLAQLASLKISGGDLSASDALAPLAGLPNLSELVIYDSSVSSAMPIAEWLDDPSNGFENGDSQSRIDLLREPGPTCREVGKIWEKGLLFSLDSGVGEGVCQPDRLELHIKQDELSGSYSVSWLPSIPPENYTGTSYYEISYQESGSSDSFLETVPDAFSGGMSLDIDLPDGHDDLVFRGRACRDDGVCSEWSDDSYPVYPLQRPYGVTFDPATKRLEWNYESRHSFETGEGIFFEVSPLFPVFDPVVVEAAGSSAWGYTVASPEGWPGRVATVRACREVSPGGTDCGPGVEIRMELVAVDETIPAPQSVSLSGRGGAGGKYSLSWQPVDNERVTHYRVRETVNSNQGQRQNHFAVEADQFDIFRFAVDSSADYEVAACQKDRENGDRCSDYTSVDNGASVDPPSSYNLGPIERLCWEHVHGHETPKDDNNGIYYAAVRLRWKYNTEAHDAPEQFIGWYNTPFGFEYGRHTDPTLKFSQLTPGVNGQHYWKSSEAGPGRLSQPGLSVGTSPDGISSSYTIKAAIPKAGSGDEWITGPESFEITPLKWDLAKGEPKWDTDTKCKDSDWPTQSSNKPAGGPGALVPGHWITRADGANADDPALGMVNGWRFYWTSGIDYDPASGTFGLSYDLLAFWYTYQLIDGEWSPVWLYSRMQADNGTKGDYAEGALIYPVKDGLDEVVGNVRIYFNDPDDKSSSPVDNHQHAWVDLSVNAGNGLNKNSQFRIMDFLLDEDYFEPGGFGHPNQSQHYRGVWIEGDKALFDDQGRILQSSNLIMSEWADTSMTSMTIQSFDDHGLPIWFIHFDCNQNGPGTKCDESYRPDISESQTVKAKDFHTYHPAIDPFFIAKDAQEETSASNSLVLAEPSGQGVVRQLKNAPLDSSSSSYDPKLDLTQGLLCAGFDDQFGSRGFNVQLGSSNCNKSNIAIAGAKISKIANFHDIDFVLPNADSPEEQTACDLSESAGQDYCKLLLTWFTDDYNPNAQPMYSTATDGANLRHINDLCTENTGTQFDFAVVQLECNIKNENIADSETFRFHLVNNPLPNGGFDEHKSAIIATSRALKVMGGTEVPIETPPEVVMDPPPGIDSSSSRVGSTGGEFEVSHAGAAEYTIPVMAAAGSGGVSPEISLDYSSMAGNGPMGAGWSIGGFSAITRCGQTYEQDDVTTGVTLTAEDRFCLDGQRLIQTAGNEYGEPDSQYRLEIDSFLRITAKGNAGGFPQYFVVEGKDGSSSVFGSANGSGSSSVKISDSSSAAIYAWPIDRFEDSAGNYIEYEYYHPGKNSSSPWIEWLPKSANYTGNVSSGLSPYAAIEFEYSDLEPDQITDGFVSGASLSQTQLLKKVKSSTNGNLLREYRIAYTFDAHGRHLVESLQECWGSGVSECYEPLTMDWYLGAPGFKTSHPAHAVASFDKFKGAVPGDLSGDGRNEFVIIKGVGKSGIAAVDVIQNVGIGALDLVTNTQLSQIGCAGLKASDIRSPLIADLEGNGMGGFVYIAAACNSESDTGIYYHSWDASSQRLSQISQKLADLPEDIDADKLNLALMDLNGNGVIDLLLTSEDLKTNKSVVVHFGWAYRNISDSEILVFEGPQDISVTYDGDHLTPPREAYHGSCGDGEGNKFINDRDSYRLFKLPQVAVDQSGQPAIGVQVTRNEFCMDSPLSTSSVSSGGNVFSKSLIFQVVESESGFKLHPWDLLGEDVSTKHIYSLDLNADGYTDFITLQEVPQSKNLKAKIHVNNGAWLLEPVDTPVHVDKDLADHLQVLDYTGNGIPDLLIPEHYSEHHARWCVYEGHRNTQGQIGFKPQKICSGPKAGKIKDGSQTLFVDLWGNAVTDAVSVVKRGGSSTSCSQGSTRDYCVYVAEGVLTNSHNQLDRFSPANKIRSITDGFGAWTEIEYGSLAQPQVHKRDYGSHYEFGRGSAVYDFAMPMYVVRTATSLSPHHKLTGTAHGSQGYPEGTARIDYFYRGAKIQAGGRGFLGFRQVSTYDASSGVLTATNYRQDFPFTGRPAQTSTIYYPGGSAPWDVEGHGFNGAIETGADACGTTATVGASAFIELGRSVNSWALLGSASDDACQTVDNGKETRYCHPYLQKSEEYSCAVSHNGAELTGSSQDYSVITETTLTSYGDVDTVTVTNMDLSGPSETMTYQQSTVNEYSYSESNLNKPPLFFNAG